MGLLSSIGKSVSKVFGSKSVGGFLNDITGASSASAQSQKYALQSAEINNKYQKEFAKNAHQWEVKDLQNAGLNPILSAGGSGAGASGGGVASATETSAGLSPIDAIGAGISAYNGIQNGKQIKAITDNTDADTLLKKAETQMKMLELAIRTKASPNIIAKYRADLNYTREQTKLLKAGKLGQWGGTDIGGTITEAGKKQWKKLLDLFGMGE